MQKFLEIYGTLPRGGPGSNELTRRAYQAMIDVPDHAKILDVGCGPGMQTIELLRLTNGKVVAVDLLPEMIARVEDEAKNAGLSDRLETHVQDMQEMSFPPESFDVIWAEGSVYLLGFENGLKKFKELAKTGGYLAVSEVVWLKANPPTELVEFWQEYPEIDTVDAKLEVVEKVGLELVDHFVFPSAAWTEHYYGPMEKRVNEKVQEWQDDPEGQAVLKEATNEISLFRNYSDFYSYAFFVMRRRTCE